MSFPRRGALTLVGGALVLPFAARAQTAQPSQGRTLAAILISDDRFDQFERLLQQTGAMAQLNDPSRQFTVFAPTDAAFAMLPGNYLQELRGNPLVEESSAARASGRAGTVALAHIVASPRQASSLMQRTEELPAMNGGRIRVDGTKNPIEVTSISGPGVLSGPGVSAEGTIKVIAADIIASNGVIHAIDGLMRP